MGWLSGVMPLSYPVEALTRVTTSSTVDAVVLWNLLVVACCALPALVLGAATLPRWTP
jgi:ABC-2 type transport system permease protein